MNRRDRYQRAGLLLLGLALLPAGIWLALSQWGNRRHLIVSTLLLAVTALPFLLRLERKRPQARRLVLLAVLIAMGVVGRELFFWLPQGKPVAALVLVTGAALGAESGFLTGAAIAFSPTFSICRGRGRPGKCWRSARWGWSRDCFFPGAKKRRPGWALPCSAGRR